MQLYRALIIAAACFTAVVAAQEVQDTSSPSSKTITYKGHQVITVQVRSKEELNQLADFVKKNRIDAWTALKLGQVDIRIPPELREAVKKTIKSPIQVKIPDLQQAITESNKEEEMHIQVVADSQPPNLDFFRKYHTYEELLAFVRKLHDDYPSNTEIISTGKSYEGRDLFGLRIKGKNPKKKFVFNGGIHAREWISPATTTYIMNALVGLYGKDQKITSLVDNYDIHIIPLLNPDGYAYTLRDRMWRKNRQPNRGSSCVGTDNNRNFNGPNWGGTGSSNNPCDEDYHGPSAFSAPESKGMANLITAQKPDIYIDFHSYSQEVYWPWGYTCDLDPPNTPSLSAAAKKFVDAVRTFGTSYTAGQSCRTSYPTTGDTVDWATAVPKVPYAYTIELRDKGRYGFILPPAQIIPSGNETLAGVLEMMQYVLTNPKKV
ncbi:uncharacterized protein VTP21DRAFT_7158 [Calcarisporiella thermophila]|uniref:uncharacterized protein n=1 Tax=Calcarisporiella thermophila TaxID=911321 RepID=UPI003743065B